MSESVPINEGARFAVPFKTDSRIQIDEEELRTWDLSLPDDVSFPRLELGSGIDVSAGTKGTMLLEVTEINPSRSGEHRYVQAVVREVDVRNRPEVDEEEAKGLGYRNNLHWSGNDLAGPTSTVQKSNSDRPL